MNKKQYEDNNFIIYAPDTLKFIIDKMIGILNKSFEFYKKLFDINKFRKVQINFFDEIDDFKDYLYSLGTKKDSLPEYTTGTYDKGMINAYINPKILFGTKLYYKNLHLASHELFHIMYKELILQKYNINRIIWFDEGMAQLFSLENDFIFDPEKFKIWINNIINETKDFPNLNELNHGTSFVNEKYNGYDLSLLVVKYLYDTLSFEKFKKLMRDPDKIKKYGNKLNEIIDFYKEKLDEKHL